MKKKSLELEKIIIGEYSNTAGIIAQRNGEKVYEGYFNGSNADNAVHIASVTKSIFSALIGIAVERGHIESVDRRVADFFPEFTVPPDDKTVPDITVKHLLTMTAPYKVNPEPYEGYFTSEDRLAFSLDLLGGGPAGEFLYSPFLSAHILSGILAKATGESVLDFANRNLFLPLGFQVENTVINGAEEYFAWYEAAGHRRGWIADRQGINPAGWGLTLTPGDMIKIGRLYLNGGTWEGKRLVPEAWISASTAEHAGWGDLSYGYLWWIIDGKEKIYAAMGDGGNIIYVNAKKNLTVAMACYPAPDAKDRIEFIRKYIETIF